MHNVLLIDPTEILYRLFELGAFILGYSIKGLLARWLQDHVLVPLWNKAVKRVESHPELHRKIVHHWRQHYGEPEACYACISD